MDPPADSEGDRARWREYARERRHELRDALISRYFALARITAAKLYRGRVDNSVAFADYLQYARVGLVEAIDAFDPERSVPFEAFSSYRIRGAILNGLASESEQAAQRAFWSRRERDRLESLKQHEGASDRRSSLEELVNLTMGLALGHLIETAPEQVVDESLSSNPYAMTELAQLRRAMRSMLNGLPDRERELLRRHYEDHVEFQQIAVEWGVTKGRVSQLHAQALSRLRKLLSQRSQLDRTL
jgi:RNA polymerase sigma factor FliA